MFFHSSTRGDINQFQKDVSRIAGDISQLSQQLLGFGKNILGEKIDDATEYAKNDLAAAGDRLDDFKVGTQKYLKNVDSALRGRPYYLAGGALVAGAALSIWYFLNTRKN